MTIIDFLTPKQIIFTKRKTLSLVIDNNGDLIVRAPLKCTEKRINEFICKKADWIVRTKQKVINNKQEHINCLNGEQISILGGDYIISLTENSTIKTENNVIYLPQINSKEKLITYLKKTIRSYISRKLAEICEEYVFNFVSFGISSAKTNWGSCSFKNRLHFTYKLALCPTQVVDYVIKHELTHTKVKNHSRTFYYELEKICPNYKECEKWLKTNKSVIDII